MTPKVSVIIPLFNKEKYITRAVQSVLDQSLEDYEIIVVDDGSTDNGPEIVKKLAQRDKRVFLLHQKNQGPSAARNAGIARASGQLIAFLDADDQWKPEFLEKTVSLMKDHPGAGLAAANYEIVHRTGQTQIAVSGNVVEPDFSRGVIRRPFDLWIKSFFLSSSSVLVPKSVLNETRGFHPELSLGEDIHLWARIMLRYPVAFTQEVLAVYHKDVETSISQTRTHKKEIPPFIFSERFFPDSLLSGVDQQQIQEFYRYRKKALSSYLCFWAGAGHWRHAAKVAKQERVSLWRVLYESGTLFKPWFYRMNLKGLLARIGFLRTK